jgi:hypothetical protein
MKQRELTLVVTCLDPDEAMPLGQRLVDVSQAMTEVLVKMGVSVEKTDSRGRELADERRA